MSIVLFDSTIFRAMFPIFSNPVQYPQAVLQLQWDLATCYITDNCVTARYVHLRPKQQVNALNLMTAHLLALNQAAANNQPAGVLTGATIDKVSVQLQPPPEASQWQWWLNQTPYGQQLLALLQVATAGGFFYAAGAPVVGAFVGRRR